jgi:hypothetical protein
MTKHLFIVTSALNTKFGLFNLQERTEQTIHTIRSIRGHIPDAKIAIAESSGVKVTPEQINMFRSGCEWFLDFSESEYIKSMYDSTDNWDIVKNFSEVIAFNQALRMLNENNAFDDIDRIHKLSGRYVLNSNFDPSLYDNYPDKIIMSDRIPTQFEDNDIRYQYISRLWSWPKLHNQMIFDFFQTALDQMLNRLKNRRYTDIEHLLYHLLPTEHIVQVNPLGVEGLLGAKGEYVNN